MEQVIPRAFHTICFEENRIDSTWLVDGKLGWSNSNHIAVLLVELPNVFVEVHPIPYLERDVQIRELGEKRPRKRAQSMEDAAVHHHAGINAHNEREENGCGGFCCVDQSVRLDRACYHRRSHRRGHCRCHGRRVRKREGGNDTLRRKIPFSITKNNKMQHDSSEEREPAGLRGSEHITRQHCFTPRALD